MISSRRLLLFNERLEECIDPYDTFIHVFSDDDIEQLFVRLEALHTSIMAAKLQETPLSRMQRRCRLYLTNTQLICAKHQCSVAECRF